jgi:hypothetical protein
MSGPSAPDEAFSSSHPGPTSLANVLRRDNVEGAAMSGSHAEEIVVDHFEGEDWSALVDADSEPELDLPVPPVA